MTKKQKIAWLAVGVLAVIAATTPVLKISQYPTTTTNDVTDLILLARTNDVTAPTNYNIKYQNFFKGGTNGLQTINGYATGTNTIATNAEQRRVDGTNYVATNLTGQVMV